MRQLRDSPKALRTTGRRSFDQASTECRKLVRPPFDSSDDANIDRKLGLDAGGHASSIRGAGSSVPCAKISIRFPGMSLRR